MHPRIRIPLWAAVALPAAAYLLRSVSRGFSFAPDLPADAIVFAGLAGIILLAAVLRRASGAPEVDDDLADHVEREHDRAGSERQQH